MTVLASSSSIDRDTMLTIFAYSPNLL